MQISVLYYIRHIIKMPRGVEGVGIDTEDYYEQCDEAEGFLSAF